MANESYNNRKIGGLYHDIHLVQFIWIEFQRFIIHKSFICGKTGKQNKYNFIVPGKTLGILYIEGKLSI